MKILVVIYKFYYLYWYTNQINLFLDKKHLFYCSIFKNFILHETTPLCSCLKDVTEDIHCWQHLSTKRSELFSQQLHPTCINSCSHRLHFITLAHICSNNSNFFSKRKIMSLSSIEVENLQTSCGWLLTTLCLKKMAVLNFGNNFVKF